ncbi:hypothetical protein Tco_0221592 [Tanacetum coccineum]
MFGNENKIFCTAQVQVNLTKEFLSSRFSMKDLGRQITPMDTSEKLRPNNGQIVSQLKYSRVIGCLMYAMTCTRHNIAFVLGKLSSGWVFMLSGGAISWAFKKQTCITNSTMEYEFVALAAPVRKLNATLAKAYRQMYNGKSRHLGVRHSMIRELIMNEMVSIEFVMSQQNLVDHLTKDLTTDLVIKSVEGMGLKSNLVAEC